jgi:hypothetical protein
MSSETILQLVGYFSTLLILISFLMTSVLKLRLVNLIGSAIFVVFAFLTKSYPTAIMNVGLCIINIYFIIRLLRYKRLTTVLPIERDNAYLHEFLRFYKDDILKYFPKLDAEKQDAEEAWFVYYDMDPVGLLLGKKGENGVLDVQMDYSIPKYRDSSVGRCFHSYLLKDKGFKTLEVRSATEKHAKYLKKVGFTEQNGVYRLTAGDLKE